MKKLLAVTALTIALMNVTVIAGDIEHPPAPCIPTAQRECPETNAAPDPDPASDIPVEILIPAIEAVIGLVF